MGNLAKLFRGDALRWIRAMKTGAFGDEIAADDAVATTFRWLEHGYQRSETALSRPEWLRLVCGYLRTPLSFIATEDNAKTADD